MHHRFVSHLRDNRDQIIESWLTGVELPPPADGGEDGDGAGVVPLAFLYRVFDRVLAEVGGRGHPRGAETPPVHLDDFLGHTCRCRDGCARGRVCLELHESGLRAFLSVFEAEWDTCGEFSALDRECCAERLRHAFSEVFAEEVGRCRMRLFRPDCPFFPAAEHAAHPSP